MKASPVGEKGFRDGLSLELVGRLCGAGAVAMGVKPRPDGCRPLAPGPVPVPCGSLVPLAPDVGLAAGCREGSWEGRGKLIDVARTLEGWSLAELRWTARRRAGFVGEVDVLTTGRGVSVEIREHPERGRCAVCSYSATPRSSTVGLTGTSVKHCE